jgi:hypothetical protein
MKMDLMDLAGRVVGRCGVDSPGSGWGLLAGCCECGDGPSGSGATELVRESTQGKAYKERHEFTCLVLAVSKMDVP